MREIKIGGIYKHFKGHIYEILIIAKDAETLEDVVVYKEIGKNKYWTRPYIMFNSEVDHEKYPDVKQKYRFEEYKID